MTYKEDELFELYLDENWEEIMTFPDFKKMFIKAVEQETKDFKEQKDV